MPIRETSTQRNSAILFGVIIFLYLASLPTACLFISAKCSDFTGLKFDGDGTASSPSEFLHGKYSGDRVAIQLILIIVQLVIFRDKLTKNPNFESVYWSGVFHSFLSAFLCDIDRNYRDKTIKDDPPHLPLTGHTAIGYIYIIIIFAYVVTPPTCLFATYRFLVMAIRNRFCSRSFGLCCTFSGSAYNLLTELPMTDTNTGSGPSSDSGLDNGQEETSMPTPTGL